MVMSVTLRGKRLGDIKGGLEAHITRVPTTVTRVKAGTKSHIDETQTKFNRTLYRSELLSDDRSVKGILEEEWNALTAKGKESYEKYYPIWRDALAEVREAYYKENITVDMADDAKKKVKTTWKNMSMSKKLPLAEEVLKRRGSEVPPREFAKRRQGHIGVALTGTLQLGNDALDAMGYEKFKDDPETGEPVFKTWSEQTPEAQALVIKAYQAMLDEACSDPTRYGKILLAQLHVDETSPHVDFVSMAIDRNDPSYTASRVVNGGYTSKEAQVQFMSDRQTVFAEGVQRRLGKEFSDTYKIERGEIGGDTGGRTAVAKEVKRRADKVLEEAREVQKETAEARALEQAKLDQQRQANEAQAKALDAEAERLAKYKTELEELEWELEGQRSELKSSETALKARISDFENERSKTIDELKRRENELLRRSEEQDKRYERFEQMRVGLTDEVRQQVQRELIGDKGMTVVKTLKQMNLGYDFANKRSISGLDRLYDELKSSKSSLFLSSVVDVNEKVMTATSEETFEIDFDL